MKKKCLSFGLAATLSFAALAAPHLPDHFAMKAGEAKSKSLPAYGYSFDFPDHYKVVTFPEKGVYSRLAFREDDMTGIGTQFEVRTYQGANSEATLQSLMTSLLSSKKPFVSGKLEKVRLLGKDRLAMSCVSGSSMATFERCLILLPTSKNEGLAILCGGGAHEGDKPNCQKLLQRSDLASVLASFKLEPGLP